MVEMVGPKRIIDFFMVEMVGPKRIIVQMGEKGNHIGDHFSLIIMTTKLFDCF